MLASCGAANKPLTRTELIEVPVTVYAPLPAALTDPLPLPAAPVAQCRTPAGAPAVCAYDALLWASDLLELLDRANADRASAARIAAAAVAGGQTHAVRPARGIPSSDEGAR